MLGLLWTERGDMRILRREKNSKEVPEDGLFIDVDFSFKNAVPPRKNLDTIRGIWLKSEQ